MLCPKYIWRFFSPPLKGFECSLEIIYEYYIQKTLCLWEHALWFYEAFLCGNNKESANKSLTPVAISVLCFDNRCDFNYYTTRRRLTDLPSGFHHGTSVLWLHAKKDDFPLEKTHSCWQLPRSHSVPPTGARVCHQKTSLSLPLYCISFSWP